MSTGSPPKISLLFWFDEDTYPVYRDNWKKWLRAWPDLARHQLACICDGTYMDDDNWRMAFDDIFDRRAKIILWEPDELPDSTPQMLAILAVSGYQITTDYSCYLDPHLSLTKKLKWLEPEWFDEDDPPAIICNRTEVGPDDVDCRTLEVWGDEAPGFADMPEVDCELIRSWDIALVATKFAKVVSMVSKTQNPVDRLDWFYYYCALKRGERITRVDNSDIGIE